MTRDHRSALAVAALVAAAATLLTGCGSGGQGRGPDPAARHTASAPPADGKADGSPAPDRPAPESTPPGPKVPKSHLTPATGSFTRKQKAYLTGRVPKGTDPAAVLQIGQETCDRITRTAKLDRKAAISAIRSGEIANAEAAITHLCPEHQPLLDAAEKGSPR